MKRNQYRISILVWRGICSCLLLLFFVAFMMACTENKLYITDQRGEAIGNYTVYFHPRLESNFVTTKSLSPFPKNCIAQVFAFSARGDQQSIGSPV